VTVHKRFLNIRCGFDSRCAPVRKNFGQVIHTSVPRSPSSNICYCIGLSSGRKVTMGLAKRNNCSLYRRVYQ